MRGGSGCVNRASGVPREIEIKFRIDAPDALRERIAAFGGRFMARVAEHNRIFDTPDGRLLAGGCALRVRDCRPLKTTAPASQHLAPGAPAATITFKGPRAPGPVKDREEHETTVGDADTAAAILNELGFRERLCYEKRRETWRLDDCEVTLDELPQLGWFAEIEGPDAATIQALADRLGLTDEHVVPESYVTLAQRHGEAVADGVRLLF